VLYRGVTPADLTELGKKQMGLIPW